MSNAPRFEQFQRRYRERDMPWEHQLPPPEVIAIAEQLPPGRALDLGCGAGRACAYLASKGWQVDGVDFIPEAIELAQARIDAAGVSERVRLFAASVTELGFLEPPYDLAVDVGCVHALEGDDLRAYAAGLARLLRPGGLYLLFAHLRQPGEEGVGISEEALRGALSAAFSFEQVEHGSTTVNEQSWSSGWFYLRRA
jgi:cyclopropane fatty-acyl-phospholipid synthase-like methyltransferase